MDNILKPSDKYEGTLIPNMDFQQYLDLPDYLHSSDLKLLQQSVNHWLKKRSYPETKALILGSLGHTMVLAEEQANSEGKILISQEDFTSALGWRENIQNDPITSNVFMKSKGQNEVSGFFKHPDFEDNKGAFRVDKLLPDQLIAIDLKIMLSAHPYAFMSSVKKFRYDIQAAWYIDGLKSITGDDYDFLFVVCEKSNPNNVQTYRLSEQTLANARDDIRSIIKKYNTYKSADSNQQNRLGGYYDGIQTLDIKYY